MAVSPRQFGPDRKKPKIRTNRQITAREVRLVDPEGVLEDESLAGIVTRDKALSIAESLEMDLVEVSPNANPPVVRVMDYGKLLYEEKKKKKKQKIIKLKEVKFRPVTDEGDYRVKLRNLLGFLEHGDKVKVTIRFRGREITHQDLGIALLKRVQKDVEEQGQVEQFPKLEGRQLIMIIAPLKKPQ